MGFFPLFPIFQHTCLYFAFSPPSFSALQLLGFHVHYDCLVHCFSLTDHIISTINPYSKSIHDFAQDTFTTPSRSTYSCGNGDDQPQHGNGITKEDVSTETRTLFTSSTTISNYRHHDRSGYPDQLTTTSSFDPRSDPRLRISSSQVPLEVIPPSTHPSVLAARSLLLALLPSPLPLPLPPLPALEPTHQRLVLLALTNLVPKHTQQLFHKRQLRFLPAEDAKVLLQYQSDPSADPRLILFPIAILRAKIVRSQWENKTFDVTTFINDTLSSAKIYGQALDPDAWEMPDGYWDTWAKWFTRGREYCHSLCEWRRRDGHGGSSVMGMLLGLEKENGRRVDPVGKPPDWSF